MIEKTISDVNFTGIKAVGEQKDLPFVTQYRPSLAFNTKPTFIKNDIHRASNDII